MQGMRRVLAVPDLRRLLGALLISTTGSWGYNVALLAFVFERTGSAAWVGAAGLARFVPMLLASPYAGVVAERVERVRLLIRVDVACAVLQAGLVVVAATGGPVEAALVLTALSAVAIAPYEPAVAALLPQLAAEERLTAANALRGTIGQLVLVLGPAIAAAVLLVGSPEVVFGVNALSFLVSALLVARLRVRSVPSDVTDGGTAGPLRQVADGFRAIRDSPGATPLVALCALVTVVYGTDTVLLVTAADERLGMGEEGYALLTAGIGVGGILAAFGVERLARAPRLAAVLLGGVALHTLPTLVLALGESAGASVAVQVLRGAGTMVVDVLAITALQRVVAPAMVARVFGVFYAVVLTATCVGVVGAPLLVELAGLQAALVALAVGPPVLALGALPTLLRADRAAAARRAALAPRVVVLQRVGLLEGAGPAALEQLAAASELREAAAGEVVVAEGEPADALYVVERGLLDVHAAGAGALPPVGPDGWFGELGLLAGLPRTATVTAQGDARLLRIDGEAFAAAAGGVPHTGALHETARVRLARTHPHVALPQPEATLT